MPCRSMQNLLAAALAVFIIAAPTCASAANGIDTASGVNNLPVNVEGVMGMTLYNTTNSSSGPVYVGVGTAIPYAPFTVHTGLDQNLAVEPASGWGVSGIALQSFNDAANLAKPLLLQGSTLYLQATGGEISIGTSASPSATISVTGNMNVTGNVGIGTTVPQAPLDVNGGVRGSNTSSVVVNDACLPEGMLGYDLDNHQPVYCGSSGQWTAYSSSPLAGYQIVSNTCSGVCNVSCPSGKYATGGGCQLNTYSGGSIQFFPVSATTWQCYGGGEVTVYVVCVNSN